MNNFSKGKFRLRITLFSKEKFNALKTSPKPVDLLIHLIPLDESEDKNLGICIYPEIVSTPISKVKTLNYLNRFIIKRFAVERGFDDALVLGPENRILEASFSNIFWVEKSTVFLPHSSLPYFRGTTLERTLINLSNSGYKICEGFFEVKDIPSCAYVYLCNSLKNVSCVNQVENRIFKTRNIEYLLRDAVP